MGKLKQGVSTAGLRVGNTIATPVRRGGEILNAGANIPRQGISGLKNIAEVTKQTGNALVHNFLNFSKVQGKWYQRFLKGSINLASAVTRRPVMIAGAGMASALNQGIRQPFKKLLYTPGKMFKGMRNATRIFSKKKGFDFQTYDTHETGGDTWVNQIQEKSFGFLGATGGSSAPAESEAPAAEAPKEATVQQSDEKKSDEKKNDKSRWKTDSNRGGKGRGNTDSNRGGKGRGNTEKKEEAGKEESKSETPSQPAPSPTPASTHDKPATADKPKSIDEIKQKGKEEAEAKDKAEQDKNFPEWKTLPDKYKAKFKKDYKEQFGDKPTKEKVLERGKSAKFGENMDEIMAKVKKDNPTMAGYIEEEILKAA